MAERFIVNKNKKRIHDSDHLSERCNTDDIDPRFLARVDLSVASNLMSDQFKPCWWCIGRRGGEDLIEYR